MTAAALTETFVGGPIGAGSSKAGAGLVWGIYSFTKASQNDWVIFDDFESVEFICVSIAGDQSANADIDGSTENKVTLSSATTGGCLAFVVGVPA